MTGVASAIPGLQSAALLQGRHNARKENLKMSKNENYVHWRFSVMMKVFRQLRKASCLQPPMGPGLVSLSRETF
jgi:hypothetical protein